MQKELSTISEKTEAPSPPDNKHNTRNKMLAPSSPLANAIHSGSSTPAAVAKINIKPMHNNSCSNNMTSSMSCSASALVLNNGYNKQNKSNALIASSSATSTKPIRNINNNPNNLDLTLNSNSQATILNQRFTFNDLNSTATTLTTNGTSATLKPDRNIQSNQQGLVSSPVQTISSQNKNPHVMYKNQVYNQSNISEEDDDDDDDEEDENDEITSSDEYDEDESNYCENCDECDFKNSNNNKKTPTKSFYSSQEDFIYSLHVCLKSLNS
jgi:hypothetical protein